MLIAVLVLIIANQTRAESSSHCHCTLNNREQQTLDSMPLPSVPLILSLQQIPKRPPEVRLNQWGSQEIDVHNESVFQSTSLSTLFVKVFNSISLTLSFAARSVKSLTPLTH